MSLIAGVSVEQIAGKVEDICPQMPQAVQSLFPEHISDGLLHDLAAHLGD
jgi:hypothetical protein